MFVGVGSRRVRDMFADAKVNQPCKQTKQKPPYIHNEVDYTIHTFCFAFNAQNDRTQALSLSTKSTRSACADRRARTTVTATRSTRCSPRWTASRRTTASSSSPPLICLTFSILLSVTYCACAYVFPPQRLTIAQTVCFFFLLFAVRPGRFDKQVAVHPPDIKGRTDILDLYMKKTHAGPDVDTGTSSSSSCVAYIKSFCCFCTSDLVSLCLPCPRSYRRRRCLSAESASDVGARHARLHWRRSRQPRQPRRH